MYNCTKTMFAKNFRTPGEAWRWGMVIIANCGDNYPDEKGYLVREIRNMVLTVIDPSSGWPIKDSGWDLVALDEYAKQLLDGNNEFGFEYTYGERLFDYDGANQIGGIIHKLLKNKFSRRAIACTWKVHFDPFKDDPPCMLVADFKLRDNILHSTHYFRSHDFGRAWPANVYGLNKLLEYVAAEVGAEAGSITTHSCSAHVYL